ncbi:LOW QUALITY PROTEIN: hypothetical protein V2J09_001803 [Rumex salicifolius]
MALIEIKISGINAQTICDKLQGRLPNSERELRPKSLREGFRYYGMRRIPRFKCSISRKISSELQLLRGLANFRSSLCMLLQRCIIDVAFGKLLGMTLLEAHARIGGSGSIHPDFDIFQGIIDDLALIYLGFSGQATTCGLIEPLLITRLVSAGRMHLFRHLPKLGSDHTPLLVTLDPPESPPTTVHFEAAWLTHANFHEFLSQSWSYDGPIVQALTCLRPKLNIEEREKNLTGKMDVIQQQLMTYPNQDLISADSAVQHELLQETLAPIGGSKHCILPLFDHHSQKEKLYSDVERLYSLNVDEMNPINLLHGLFSTLVEDRWEVLANPISDKEIYKTVHAMGANKASGPDGLQPCFYQNLWNVVGPSVTSVVRQFFDSSIMPMSLNDKIIALIAKVSCQRESRNSDPLVFAMCCSKSSQKFL